MFKKILVSTDASEYSRRAMLAAVDIAAKYGAAIDLMYVFKPASYFVTAELGSEHVIFTEQQIAAVGAKVIEETIKDIDTGQIPISKKVKSGYPATEILKESEKGIDLVIMGTRGHGPIGGALVGSVTQRILAEAKCPVLVVK